MMILRAELATEQASRYLVQFCRHAAAMGGRGHRARNHLHGEGPEAMQVTAEWSPTQGLVLFEPSGRCTLTADQNRLTLEIAASDESELTRIREIVSRDFARFTQRTPIPVVWRRPDPAVADPLGGEQLALGRRGLRRRPVRVALLVLAVLAIVGLHLGLAGTLAARSPWTKTATNVLLALVAVKLAVIGLARLRLQRSRSARARPDER